MAEVRADGLVSEMDWDGRVPMLEDLEGNDMRDFAMGKHIGMQKYRYQLELQKQEYHDRMSPKVLQSLPYPEQMPYNSISRAQLQGNRSAPSWTHPGPRDRRCCRLAYETGRAN